jgi:hypothetical protein
MSSDIVASIRKQAQNIRCFAIASDEFAKSNCGETTKQLPRSKRRQAELHEYNRWKRDIASIIHDAKTFSYEKIIERFNMLPLDAIKLAFEDDAADSNIDKFIEKIQLRPGIGIGIWEQYVSDDVVVVWLWNDK